MKRDSTDATGRSHRWLKLVVGLGVWTIILFAVVDYSGQMPTVEDWAAVQTSEVQGALAVFVVLFAGAVLCRAARWRVLLSHEIRPSFKRVALMFGWTFMVKSFTPLRAGEVIRALWARKEGGTLFYSLGVLAVERVLDIGVLVITAGIAVILIAPDGDASSAITGLIWGSILVCLLLVGTAAWATGLRKRAMLANGLSSRSRLLGVMQGKVGEATDRLAMAFRYLATPIHLVRATALTVMVWGLLSFAYAWVLMSVFPELPWGVGIVVVAAVNLLGAVGGSPGNLGSYEFAGLMVLRAFDVTSSTALPLIIVTHIAVLTATCIVGLLSRLLLAGELKSMIDLY